MSPPVFPATRQEITTAWLQHSLQHAGVLQAGQTVSGFALRPVAEQGQTSDAAIVDVVYADAPGDLPLSFLLKFSHPSLAVRQRMSAVSCYEREAHFYREYGSRAGIAVPRCYAAHYDPATFSSALLLEYIEGVHTGSRFDFTLDEMQLAVASLAAFHATWWRRDGEMAGLFDDHSRQSVATRCWLVGEALAAAREQFAREMSEEGIAALAWWLEHADALAQAARQRPRTMIHGDCHLQQMLFPTAGQGRFAVIDWQTVAIGSGASDLARLIITAMPPAMRREQEPALLALYLATLQQQGVHDYTADDLQRDYGLGLLQSLVTNSVALIGLDLEKIAAMLGSADSGPWYERVFHWPAHAVHEYGVIG